VEAQKVDQKPTIAWASIKHFEPEEFDSPDQEGSGFLKMQVPFVQKLDALREKVGFRLVVNSGFRSISYNARLRDSVDGSAHCLGCAVDLACRDSRTRFLVLKAALELGFQRMGIGPTFVHLDDDITRASEVVWLY